MLCILNKCVLYVVHVYSSLGFCLFRLGVGVIPPIIIGHGCELYMYGVMCVCML